MSVVVEPQHADEAVRMLREYNVDAYICGEVATGDSGVVLC